MLDSEGVHGNRRYVKLGMLQWYRTAHGWAGQFLYANSLGRRRHRGGRAAEGRRLDGLDGSSSIRTARAT